MSTLSQARNKDETGIPSSDNPGGYAGKVANPPSNTVLSESDQQHNAKGSFFYPPSVRSAAQAIEFWENVDISDEVLAKFELGYDLRVQSAVQDVWNERFDALVQKKVQDDTVIWERNRATPEYQRLWKKASDIQRLNQESQELEEMKHNLEVSREEAEREVPPLNDEEVAAIREQWPELNRTDVRPLVRAAAMYWYTPDEPGLVDVEERQKISDHQVEMAYGRTMTVADIERDFRLSEFGNFFLSK